MRSSDVKDDDDDVAEDANEGWRFHFCDGEWPPVAMAVEVFRYPITVFKRANYNYSYYQKVCDNDDSVVYNFDSG